MGMRRGRSYLSINRVENATRRVLFQRLYVVMTCFALGFLILAGRLADISILIARPGSEEAEGTKSKGTGEASLVRRAEIVDRNGVLLAVNLPTASLYVNPSMILDPAEDAKKIAALFPNLNAKTLKAELSSSKSFVWIKRNLTPTEQQLANNLGIPGLVFEQEERRVYPQGNLFSHTLGYVDIDGNGIAGVEKTFDDYLKIQAHTNGEPLRLSLDVRAQDVLHDSLAQGMERFKAKAASGIIMDVNTAQVIAMVSLPDFDPHYPGEASADAKFNRLTLGVYEMGSTFKTFNMALGLQSGKATMESKYDVTDPIRAGRFRIKDYHSHKGFFSFPEVYIHSSNIGSVKIAMDAGEGVQQQFLKSMGVLDPLTIELPETTRPLFPAKWSKVSSMTISYGHGIAVTPVHVVTGTSALLNGGTFHPATVLLNPEPVEGKRVVEKKVSDNIRKLMRYAVKYGTGGKADVPHYLVGGKTGSADKPSSGHYNERALISSFIGAFPMQQPKYVVFVMLDEPKGNASTGGFATGGAVAAPVAADVISRIGPLLGVKPVDENDYEIKREFWYDKAKEAL